MAIQNIIPVFPIEGDVLHALDGTVTAEGLNTIAKVKAPAGSKLKINGVDAKEEDDGVFTAPLLLTQYKNQLTILDGSEGAEIVVNVYWASQFAGGYRLSIDDNTRFLQDIAANADSYQSIFDNAYLKGLQKLHNQYGTKVHLNLFYQSVEADFNLSQFPEKFKEEWVRNANWLRLSFHAFGEFPDAPYKNSPFDVVKQDCDLVMGEIRRFASDTLLGPVTTVHWGEVNIEGSRALRAAGYKGQLGYFNVDDDSAPVSYYLSVEQRRHIKKRFIWKDVPEDIVFIRSSIVLDVKKHEEIVPFLEAYRNQSGLPPYVDFLIHEQYYYPDYVAYQPDYFEKIETAIKWASSNGYKPAFLEDSIFN